MSKHLEQLIADVRELAALVGNEKHASKALQQASMAALCHAIQAERATQEVAPQAGLIGDTSVAGLKVRESE